MEHLETSLKSISVKRRMFDQCKLQKAVKLRMAQRKIERAILGITLKEEIKNRTRVTDVIT